MKRVMFATVLAAACAAGSVAAQQAGQQPGQQAGQQPAAQQEPQRPSTRTAAETGQTTMLGTVRIARNVTADGKPLPSGSYQVRLTAEEAKPPVVGQDEKLERWVEFVQRGQVKGREVVSIVPQDEIAKVAETKIPRPGTSRVELLKGNEYVRVWINKGGTHYLIHLPTGMTSE